MLCCAVLGAASKLLSGGDMQGLQTRHFLLPPTHKPSHPTCLPPCRPAPCAAREPAAGWCGAPEAHGFWVCKGHRRPTHLHPVRHSRLSGTGDHPQQGQCLLRLMLCLLCCAVLCMLCIILCLCLPSLIGWLSHCRTHPHLPPARPFPHRSPRRATARRLTGGPWVCWCTR